jgi:exosortase A-associated hydrolase 2
MIPFFVDSQSGPLFANYWSPKNVNLAHAVLHVPAFAEEMNKSRRMVALQAESLAEQGYSVLVIDLFGCGDSAGDFGEATWSLWLDNISDAITWLKQQGVGVVSLWGLRLGALLAMDFVSQHPGVVENLVVWQPVLNSESFVTQFLRLRIAAAMMNNAMPQEKTSDLKKQLQQGGTLEVAGYLLNPELMNPLMALKIDPASLMTLKKITMFEIVMGADTQSSFVNQQFLENLIAAGVDAGLIKVVGDSFWASQEIVIVPALLKATTECLRQW